MPDEKHIEELIAWLETDEGATREWRARRLSHLLEAIQVLEYPIPFRGELSSRSFEEVRLAYIHGLYLATVLLSLACIEREVAGRLYEAGWNMAKDASLNELLLEAHDFGILSGAELDTFQHLRKIRNSYGHFRPPFHRSSLAHRSVEQGELSGDVMKTDAKQAIEALGSFFGRQWGMGSEVEGEDGS